MLEVLYRQELGDEGSPKEEVDALRSFLPSSRQAGRVLDLGCGDGRLMAEWVTAGFEYLGVDHDSRLLERASKRHPTLQNSFLCGDVSTMGVMPSLRGRDIVTAVGRLVHFLPDTPALENLFELAAKSLAEWGVFVVDVESWPGRFVSGYRIGSDDQRKAHWFFREAVEKDSQPGCRFISERMFIWEPGKSSAEVKFDRYKAWARCPQFLELIGKRVGLRLIRARPAVGSLSHLLGFARAL